MDLGLASSLVQGGFQLIGGWAQGEQNAQARQKEIEFQQSQMAMDERMTKEKQNQEFATAAQTQNSSQQEFLLRQSNALNKQKIDMKEANEPSTKMIWVLGGVGLLVVISVFGFIFYSNKSDKS